MVCRCFKQCEHEMTHLVDALLEAVARQSRALNQDSHKNKAILPNPARQCGAAREKPCSLIIKSEINMKLTSMPHRNFVRIGALACVVAIGFAAWARAGDEPNEDAKTSTSVDDLAWIAGNWQGEIFGGPIQEMWTAPTGGSMAGVSRMGASAKRATYESLLIEEVDGVPTMFLRHFGTKLAAREGKDAMVYPLESLKNKTAVFKTADTKLTFGEITYSRDGDDLKVKLVGKRGDKPFTVNCTMKQVTAE